MTDGVAMLSIFFQRFFNVLSRLRDTSCIGVRPTIKVLCCIEVTAGLTSRLLWFGRVAVRGQVEGVRRRGSVSLTVAVASCQGVAVLLTGPSALPFDVVPCQIGMMTCAPRGGLDPCYCVGA